jgi:hypothetical protein
MNFFSDYIKAFKAEWLKLRNSGMFSLVLIMTAFIPGAFYVVGLGCGRNAVLLPSILEKSWKVTLSLIVSQVWNYFLSYFSYTGGDKRLTKWNIAEGGWKLIEVQTDL